MTVIRKTAMAMMKLLIRRPCPRVGAAQSARTADGTACRRVALHQSALNHPFGRASQALPARAKLPPIFDAIITQLGTSLDQDFAASTAACPLWAGIAARLPAQAWCYRCR